VAEKTRSRASTALRFLALFALSLASLAGGAVVASSLTGTLRMAAGLAGLAGYVVLFGRAMRRLPVDWNAWLDRSLEGFRSTAERSSAAPGRAA